MKRSGPSRLQKFLSSLPGRIMLVVLTAIVIAAVTPLLFLFNQTIIPVALRIIAIACVGLASGFAARQLLHANTRLLSMLVAFIAVYASLWLLSILTTGYIGIRPFQTFSGPDWKGLVQLIFGTIIAWLVLHAWRKPTKAGQITTIPARTKTQASTRKRKNKPAEPTRKRVTPEFSRQITQFIQSQYWLDKWSQTQNTTSRHIKASQNKLPILITQPVNWINRLIIRTRVSTNSAQKSIKVRARKRARRSKQPQASVRLTGAVEHRCPFCLELVNEKDARGVKVCPICHTHHHADCWEVTGTCQVPHMHE
jgi:hypothetical protein